MSDSTLINGLGRFVDDPTAELAVINVEQGKRYVHPAPALIVIA